VEGVYDGGVGRGGRRGVRRLWEGARFREGPHDVRSVSPRSLLHVCGAVSTRSSCGPSGFAFSSTKVRLYASLDKTLDEHGAVLGERDKVLVGARASLVKEGANVLGGV